MANARAARADPAHFVTQALPIRMPPMRTAPFAAPFALLAAILICGSAFAANPHPSRGTLTLDPAHTQISFTLGGSIHTTEGTFQLKSGTITADPETGQANGQVVIDANSANTNESMRDSKMKGSVLETQRYPEIFFVPERISGHENPNGDFAAKVTGVLRLHGSDHEITLDVSGHLAGNYLAATTHFVVPYVAWGMTDPSVLFLRVADVVDVTIAASGHMIWGDGVIKSAPSSRATPAR
jgi:polyisoprenoid-binding protein YceI